MRFTSCVAGAMVALAACGSWAPSPLAAARDLPGLPGMEVAHELQGTAAFTHSAAMAAEHGGAGGLDLSHDGRQLSAFAAVGALTSLAGSLLDAFIGVGANAAVTAIFGSQEVPVDLVQLFDDALAEIDRIVGDQISEAFNAEKQALLNSLGRQVREYTRRNDLGASRDDVGDMLSAASDLLSFFEANGVVTNAAFQTTLALRLALLLELLQLDQLLGESPNTLAAVTRSIRAQARDGRAALEDWAATFRPVEDRASEQRIVPCATSAPTGACRKRSSRRADITVCMVLQSPGLARPDPFCREESCRSEHLFGRIRERRIARCLNRESAAFSRQVREHARRIGIVQFRERNEATVFGEGFRAFLADLASVEDLEFADVSLPDVGSAAGPAGVEA